MYLKTKILAIILLLISVVGADFSAFGQDSIFIQLKWKHQFQFAGYYAAVNKGYFKELGLDVRLMEGGPRVKVVDEVENGRVQYAVSSSEIISDYIAGKPLSVVTVFFQHSPYVLLASAQSNIKRPSDLIDKRVMVANDQGWTQIKAIFLKEGIDPALLKVQQHQWGFKHLDNGEADAMSAYSSFEPFMLEKMGIKYNMIKPVDYGVDFYGDLLFSTQDYVKNNPEEVEKVRDALIKGWAYAFEYREEMADYILTLPGAKERGIDKTILLKEAEELYNLAQPDLIALGHMNKGRWQAILNTYKELGMAPADITLGDFIFTTTPDEYRHKFKNAFYISLALLVSVLFVLAYNYQLKKEVKKQTQKIQTTTDELMLSNAELEKFAYVASHNLRAPVVNIISLLSLYNRENPSAADNSYIIDKLESTTKNLHNTLKDLIQVVSSKSVGMDTQELNIERVYEEVKESISELIISTETTIYTHFEVKEIYYSHKVLTSILINLLTNSIKYRRPEVPAIIEVSTRVKNNKIELRVTDNGLGINLKKHGEKLFGLFQRFNTNIEGSGIGLHIVKKQVETLGGEIKVESTVNVGTTFYIYINSLPKA
ncbi:MAG: ABC transporter substrate-binding protein [Bacteroidia bacterium]